jgi:branched-chain amino acid aminotransferase
MTHFDVQLVSSPRPRPADNALGFGKHFADHMFVAEWTSQRGWHHGRIVPYGPMSLEPAASVLHYGQAMFEGMKAFRGVDGKVRLFRLEHHCRRMAEGAPRLCMPPPDPEMMSRAITQLVRTDAAWVPSTAGTALYIRPTLVATEPFLGVRPADHYTFFIITSPVGAYYEGGMKPVKIWVERTLVRAPHGGLGAVKASANYAASLLAAENARKAGYAQVLWLDAAEHKWLEEVGTMNLVLKIRGELVTPPLEGSILAGVTRDCVITLAREWGLKVVERPISLDEVVTAHRAGGLEEVFGTGTAAVISPVGELAVGPGPDDRLVIHDGVIGETAKRLYDEITGIQYASRPDTHGWLTEV